MASQYRQNRSGQHPGAWTSVEPESSGLHRRPSVATDVPTLPALVALSVQESNDGAAGLAIFHQFNTHSVHAALGPMPLPGPDATGARTRPVPRSAK